MKIYAVMKGGEILDISTCERETREIAETCCGSMVELVPRESAPAPDEREIAAQAIEQAAREYFNDESGPHNLHDYLLWRVKLLRAGKEGE